MSLLYSVHYTRPLLSLANTELPLAGLDPRTAQFYRQIDTILKPPFTADAIQDVLTRLQNDVQQQPSDVVLQVVLAKIAFGLYANALDLYLDQASTAQDDAEWWADVEQSNRFAALYLLQSKPAVSLPTMRVDNPLALPKRILNLLRVLRSRDALHLSTFRPSSLFSPRSQLQPNPFVSLLFPHLKQSSSGTLTRFQPAFCVDPPSSASTILPILRDAIKRLVNKVTFALYFPLRLARDECRLKRQEDERIRNDNAEVLGKLVGMRPALMRALTPKEGAPNPDFLVEFVVALGSATSIELSGRTILSNFVELSKTILVTRKQEHASYLDDQDLRRPSRLTLLWPRLVLLPPLTLYCVKILYASRATVTDLAVGTVETIHNFVTDWLLEPLREVFRTIRAGGEEGVIVRREAVSADLNVCCTLSPGSLLSVLLDSLWSEWHSHSLRTN